MNVGHSFRCFVFTFAAAASARAADLDWDAPAGCPDRDALRWRIEEALGTTLAHAAPLHFSAKVEKKSVERWLVELDVTSDSSETEAQHRELEAPSCDELVQAVSVAVALALGADRVEPQAPTPESKSAPPEPPAPAPPEPESKGAPQLTRAAVPQKKSTANRSYWFAADLGPVFDIGSLPGLAPGIQGSVIAGNRALGAKLAGVALPNQEKSEAGKPGGTFTLIAVTAAACGVSPDATTIVRLCLGSEFGRLSGKGENTTRSWTGNSSWVAPMLDLAGSWALFDDSLRLYGTGGLAIPLIRKEFVVEHYDVIHRPGKVIGRVGAGLEWLWR